MGLHGSSTTALIFQDVKVPAENVLGEVGKGHKVAFNVLNFARFKLGAMCGGGAHRRDRRERRSTRRTRRQFGQPIATFGAIKHKLGEMVVRTYAIESLLYRTAGLVDARIAATPHERDRRIGGAGRVRGVRRRGVDREGRRQRSARLRARREHPDPRRQRLRARLPGRAPLPRRARQPHLRRHQRDQPPADSGHAGPPRGQGRPAAHSRRQGAAGRAARAAGDAAAATATARSPTSGARSTRSRRRR